MAASPAALADGGRRCRANRRRSREVACNHAGATSVRHRAPSPTGSCRARRRGCYATAARRSPANRAREPGSASAAITPVRTSITPSCSSGATLEPRRGLEHPVGLLGCDAPASARRCARLRSIPGGGTAARDNVGGAPINLPTRCSERHPIRVHGFAGTAGGLQAIAGSGPGKSAQH